MIPKIVIRNDLFDGGANHNRANELLQKYYESSPTALDLTHTPDEKTLEEIRYNTALAQAALEAEKQGHW